MTLSTYLPTPTAATEFLLFLNVLYNRYPITFVHPHFTFMTILLDDVLVDFFTCFCTIILYIIHFYYFVFLQRQYFKLKCKTSLKCCLGTIIILYNIELSIHFYWILWIILRKCLRFVGFSLNILQTKLK